MRSVALVAPERRTYQFRLADVDTTDSLSYLEGRAVPYGVEEIVGWYWEQHDPEVFAESLASRSNLPLLMWHNGRTWPVGVAQEWTEARDGLHGVWRLDGSDEAQRAARMARDGFMTGMSVGFDPRTQTWRYTSADEWNPDDPATFDRVTRHTARLVEVSLVPVPAFNEAQVTLVRTADTNRRGIRPGVPVRTTPDLVRHADSRPHLDYWRAVRETLNPRQG
jgi:HK97 family phage prohead protease